MKETVLSVVHANAKDYYRLGILCEDYRNSNAAELVVIFDDEYPVSINAMKTYIGYGSISSPQVSHKLMDMGYLRDHQRGPIGLVKFYFEKRGNTDVYTFAGLTDITKVSGKKVLVKEGIEYPYDSPEELIDIVWK